LTTSCKFEAQAAAETAAADRKRDTVEHLAGLFIEQHAKRKAASDALHELERGNDPAARMPGALLDRAAHRAEGVGGALSL
jgi:hypothetical protein